MAEGEIPLKSEWRCVQFECLVPNLDKQFNGQMEEWANGCGCHCGSRSQWEFSSVVEEEELEVRDDEPCTCA